MGSLKDAFDAAVTIVTKGDKQAQAEEAARKKKAAEGDTAAQFSGNVVDPARKLNNENK